MKKFKTSSVVESFRRKTVSGEPVDDRPDQASDKPIRKKTVPIWSKKSGDVYTFSDWLSTIPDDSNFYVASDNDDGYDRVNRDDLDGSNTTYAEDPNTSEVIGEWHGEYKII